MPLQDMDSDFQHSLLEGRGAGCHKIFSGLQNISRINRTQIPFHPMCPEGILLLETSNSQCLNFQVSISFVLIGITCALGMVGNILSMLTLQRDPSRSVTTFLLTALSVADICFILPAVVVIMVPTYCEYFQNCAMPLRSAVPFIQQYGWVVTSFSHSCTVYITVLVAVHRYFFVCRPHECHQVSGLPRAQKQAFLIPICSLLFNLPRAFEYKVKTIKVKITNVSGESTFLETTKELTSFANNMWYQVGYKTVLYYTIMYIIPLISLIVLSLKLIQTLYRRRLNRFRGQLSQSHIHRRDDSITFVLVIIIVIFIICQTPTLAQRLLLAITSDDEPHKCGRAYFYLEQVADYFVVLNSCINFAIYFLFAKRFRQTLMKEVFKCQSASRGHESELEAPLAMKAATGNGDLAKLPADNDKEGTVRSLLDNDSGGLAAENEGLATYDLCMHPTVADDGQNHSDCDGDCGNGAANSGQALDGGSSQDVP